MGNSESANATCYDHLVTYNTSSGRHRGTVLEVICGDKEPCTSWLLLPAENLWSEGLRGFLYILGMLYIFIGMAIASDIFMMSIEVITSRKRTIVLWDEERQERVERKVLIWNETVSNLTLMALGSSAPEILIAIVETISNLPMTVEEAAVLQNTEALGVFTIMGSASYNLLMISAICILAPKLPECKKVSQFTVFVLTSAWSLWAYIWMLLVMKVISPGVVEIWEAFLTLLFFPILTLMAYGQDNGWWLKKCKGKTKVNNSSTGVDTEEATANNVQNIRVLKTTSHPTGRIHGPSKELKTIQQNQRDNRMSISNLTSADEELGIGMERMMDRYGRNRMSITSHQITNLNQSSENSSRRTSVMRFRHAAMRPLVGRKGRNNSRRNLMQRSSKSRLTLLNGMHDISKKNDRLSLPPIDVTPAGQYGRFTFAAPNYSCLESAGPMEVQIKFNRRKDSSQEGNSNRHSANSTKSTDTTSTMMTEVDSPTLTGVVSVYWETREGSAKAGRDFQYCVGKLTFEAEETMKTVTIPIINDNDYEPDKEFYVILKNPDGEAALGDPSIARATIIDDDEPGDFLLEKTRYHAVDGIAEVTIVRINGSDGDIQIEYSTLDGTAKGGESLKTADYITMSGKLEFKHRETRKTLCISCSATKDHNKNLILGIRNPSNGAKIGQHSAAVVSLKKAIMDDDIEDQLVEVLAEEDEANTMNYASQFQSALTINMEEGEEASWLDYVMHFVSMPWKILCAIIPPKTLLGAYPTFICSILWIAGMSAVIEQLAQLVGCVINFRTAATGVTLVALGTSVPDTFASRTAAKQDEFADAAIGNITGSNSVNVFLGLGLPWVLSSLWHKYYIGVEFKIATGNVTQAVILFCITGTICLTVLFIRRVFAGGELGGSKLVAFGSAGLLASLWVMFVLFIILLDYKIIRWSIG